MRLNKAIQLKTQIVGEVSGARKKQIYTTGLQSADTALSKRRPETRLAVGYSRLGDEPDDYILELRVQRKGVALTTAERIAREVGGDANIEIIPEVLIQPRREIMPAARAQQHMCQRVRPLHIGLSIGHPDGSSGTLCCFVELANGRDALLSCNHVIALLGAVNLDDTNLIFQPGPDQKALTTDDAIATLADIATLSSTHPNEADSAVAELREAVSHEGNVVPSGFQFAGRAIEIPPPGFLPLKNSPVYKLGKATGFTEGKLAGYGIDGISVKTQTVPPRNLTFKTVMQVDWKALSAPFSSPGDSGSLLFTESGDSLYALGMLFAGGYKVDKGAGRRQKGVSLCCDIGRILKIHKAAWL